MLTKTLMIVLLAVVIAMSLHMGKSLLKTSETPKQRVITYTLVSLQVTIVAAYIVLIILSMVG